MGWAKYMEDNNEIIIDHWHFKNKPISGSTNNYNSEKIDSNEQSSRQFLTCEMCGKTFLFPTRTLLMTAGSNECFPKRCINCRSKTRSSSKVLTLSERRGIA